MGEELLEGVGKERSCGRKDGGGRRTFAEKL